jgi:SAM-dependent methyltransferase
MRSASLRRTAHRFPPIAIDAAYRAVKASAAVPGAVRYLADRRRYQALPQAEALRWRDAFPKIGDWTLTTPFDVHYLHQDSWAAQRVAETRPPRHVDVGSRVELACFLTAVTPVTFVDIRPLEADVENLTSVAGSVLELPFTDRSLPSVSCLHVVEHIGLGRYGDPLDPSGTLKAIRELQRVVAPAGHLLFSLPVGRPRVCFNAHRIHDPRAIRELFDELDLVEFAGVDDGGRFRRDLPVESLAHEAYGCGMYHLVRRT